MVLSLSLVTSPEILYGEWMKGWKDGRTVTLFARGTSMPTRLTRSSRISLYYFLFYSTIAVWAPYFALYLHFRGLQSSSIGWILAIYPAVGLLIQPLWGIFNDHFHREWWTVVSAIILAPMAAWLFTQVSLAWYPLVAIAMATFQTAIMPVADSMTVGWLGPERYGESRLFGSLGYALIVAVAGLLYHTYGIGHFVDFYLLASILAVIGGLQYPRPQSGPVKPKQTRPPWYAGLGALLSQPRFRVILFFSLFVTVSQSINASYFSLYYRATDHPLSWLGIILGIGAVSEIPVFYLSGRWIRRYGPARMLCLSGSIFAFRWLVVAFNPPTWGLVLLQCLHGPSFGLGLASGINLAAEVSHSGNRVSAQSLYSATSTGMAPLLGSIAGGYVLGWVGPTNFYWVDLAISLIGVAGIAHWVITREQSQTDGAPERQTDYHER